MDSKTLVFIGRTGSGKSTQIKKLQEKFGFKIIGTGDLMRALAKEDSFCGKKLHKVLTDGGLPPEWFATYLWINELFKLQPADNVIFDGSPRRLAEATRMSSVLKWLGRENTQAVLIDISEDEAIERLKSRGRHDDELNDIKRKFKWYKRNVEKVITYYKKRGKLIKINGNKDPESIHEEVLESLKLS